MPRISGRERSGSPRKPSLRPYQAEGVSFLERVGRGFLADEPGLGKTRQLIEASRGSTLAVAPAMVLDGGTWTDEVARWADDPGRFTSAAFSALNDRVKTGTNSSATRPVHDRVREEYDRRWDTLIVDEAHYLKGRGTSWTTAVKKMRYDRLFLATGTPFPNWADEMFVPLQLLYPEEARPSRRLGSYWRWAKEWFDCSPNRFSQGNPVVGDLLRCSSACLERPAYDPCDHYLEFAAANFGDRYLRRLRDEVLTDLPPLTEVLVRTPMTRAQASAYRKLKKDFVAWAEDGTEIVAWNDAAKHSLLDKASTGLGALVGGAWKESESGKLQRLVADLGGRSRPTLVVAHYRPTVDGTAEYVRKKLGMSVGVVHGGTTRPARQRVIADFKAGKLDALFATIDTIAEGLQLTVADTCIFLEKSYVPSRNTQAMRRVHRMGQDRPVTVLDYVTPDSTDSGKRELLATKVDRQLRHLRAADLVAYT